ncbi:MAG TPA: YcnI family protein [Rhodocyclaceae bacterium]
MSKWILSIFAGLACATAQAHVVLDNKTAPAGSYYRGALRVGHGCEGAPVRQVVVTIPEGVQGAKPMPKAGWKIDIERHTLTRPYTSHGRTVTEDVSEIRWTARSPDDYLPDSYFDEFVVFAKLPETPGTLYWKVSQICEQGRIDWHEIPQGDAATKLQFPAAVLRVDAVPTTPAKPGTSGMEGMPGMAGHAHSH